MSSLEPLSICYDTFFYVTFKDLGLFSLTKVYRFLKVNLIKFGHFGACAKNLCKNVINIQFMLQLIYQSQASIC